MLDIAGQMPGLFPEIAMFVKDVGRAFSGSPEVADPDHLAEKPSQIRRHALHQLTALARFSATRIFPSESGGVWRRH